LVRIQRRLSRKRYLGGKYAYEYERLSLDIPRKFHKKVKPFIGQDLEIEISVKGSYLVIALSPRKRFGTPNATPEKLTPEKLIEAEF
jgi:antitoxin component of MazEF toxin-antitoxin module